MKDAEKTKEMLISEIRELRQRVTELDEIVTERKENAETLRTISDSSQDAILMSELIKVSPAVIYKCEAAGQFPTTFVSDNVINQMSYTPNDFTDDPTFWADHIHPDDKMRVFANLESLFEEGRHSHEYRFLCKDGTYRWMYDQLRLLRDTKGNPINIIGNWIDITERKQSEIVLRESEEQYRNLVDTITDGVQENDLDGTIIYCNKAYAAMNGYTKNEIIGKMKIWNNAITEEEAEEMKQYLEYIKKEQPQPILYITQNKKSDGNIIDVQVNWNYKRNEQGEIIGFVSVIADITERMEAEKALKESEERNKLILNGLPFAALLTTRKRRVKAFNKTADDLGITMNSYCWASFGKCMFVTDEDRKYYEETGKAPPTHPHCQFCMADECLDKNELCHKEVFSDGSWFDTYWCPIENDLLLHYAIDITERKKMENELRQAHKMAAVGTLAGGIAHEFNNALYAILLNLDMIKKYAMPDDKLYHNAEIALKACNWAAELMRQILTFSRKGDKSVKDVNLVEIVKEGLEMMRASTPSAIDIADSVSIASGIVRADSTQLYQVLNNLCANAKYVLQKTGGTMEVSLGRELRKAQSYLKLSVSDNGIGMPPEVKERVFEPFFTTKPVGEGKGMGLSVVYGIVEDYGGNIEIETAEGEGTTVHVYLPEY